MISNSPSVESIINETADDKFLSLIEQNLVGTYVIQDGQFVYVNKKFAELFQYDPAEICGKMGPMDLTSPDDRDTVRKNIEKRILGEERSIQYSFTAIKKDGSEFVAEVHGGRATYQDKPAVVGVILNKQHASIAEQAIQYLAIELSTYSDEEFFHELTEYLANALEVDLVLIGEYSEEQNQVEGLLYHQGDYSEGITYDLQGTPCENVIERKQCSYSGNLPEQFPEDQMLQDWDVQFYSGTPLRSSTGETIGLLSVLHTAPYPDVEICERLLKIFAHRAENELERQQKNRTIKRLAYRDPLTGLPNRTRFYEDLEQAIKPDEFSSEKLGLLFIDLDGFKQINDIFGHRFGDSVLKQISNRIKGLAPEGTLYRWGGDEFTYVLSDLKHPKTPEKLSRKILEKLELPLEVEGKEFHLSGSIGIAIYPDHAMNVETLVSRADMAMFNAKEKSGNSYQVYIEGTAETQEKQVTLKQDLKRALEQDEFILEYQPQFQIQTGELTGMEALIRWESTELGMIRPGSFIPLAEATGLIDPIGKWVLEQGCKTLNHWIKDEGIETRLSINVAPRQFRSDRLTENISTLIDQYDLPPHLLEIEITENTLMTNMEKTVEILKELRELGVRVALDDFGTGYSSLLYLAQFPLDTLKIDRTFTEMITRDSSQAEVIEILRAVANELNLNVIAEGIETELQLQAMQELGCDEGQGYLLGRPHEESKINQWARGNPTIINGQGQKE